MTMLLFPDPKYHFLPLQSLKRTSLIVNPYSLAFHHLFCPLRTPHNSRSSFFLSFLVILPPPPLSLVVFTPLLLEQSSPKLLPSPFSSLTPPSSSLPRTAESFYLLSYRHLCPPLSPLLPLAFSKTNLSLGSYFRVLLFAWSKRKKEEFITRTHIRSFSLSHTPTLEQRERRKSRRNAVW